MDVPFEIQYGDLSDEDYADLSHYYSQPYYNRDSSEIEHIRQSDWVRASLNCDDIAERRTDVEDAIECCAENHLYQIFELAHKDLTGHHPSI